MTIQNNAPNDPYWLIVNKQKIHDLNTCNPKLIKKTNKKNYNINYIYIYFFLLSLFYIYFLFNICFSNICILFMCFMYIGKIITEIHAI